MGLFTPSCTSISNIDKVSIVALAQDIMKGHDTTSISGLAKILNVPLMTENRNRKNLVMRVQGEIQQDLPAGLSLSKSLTTELMDRCHAIQKNDLRNSYAPWFKDLICKQLEQNSYHDVSFLTEIPIESLKKMKNSLSIPLDKQELSEDHIFILSAWNQASSTQKQNLNTFWMYLGCRFPNRAISFERVRQLLIDFGLRYPRGPKPKDEGAQMKTRFEPHTLWEGDGKHMKITINGNNYHFCWYCFIDQNSTLLVGSNVGATESGETFLKALENAKTQVGFHTVGILLDNRLGKGKSIDLSNVKSFCSAHGISLIHTFPGNAKSNGIIEGNFSIFEKFVGDINITGDTEEKMALSIAELISEIYTQQRNHSQRKRLGGKTPSEETNGAIRPEHRRGALERMRIRFNQEEQNINEKWLLVEDLLRHWGHLLPESIDKLKTEISKYQVQDIIGAKASYLVQVKKHPEKKYGPEYFLAIVRNKQEEQSKQIYNEAFRAGMELSLQILPAQFAPDFVLIPKLTDFFKSLVDQPSPSHIMLNLDSLAWWFIGYSQTNPLAGLWKLLEQSIESSIGISLRSWSFYKEFLVRRIRPLNLWQIT